MENIPYETVYNIAYNLNVDDILNFCRTDYSFSRLCRDWHFWYDLTKRDINFDLSYDLFVTTDKSPSNRYLQIKDLLSNPTDRFYRAVANNQVDDVLFLLNYVEPFNDERLDSAALLGGSVDLLKILVDEGYVNPEKIYYYYLTRAVGVHPENVEYILDDERFQLSYDTLSRIFISAVNNSNSGLVSRLILIVDPSYSNNLAIGNAAGIGNIEILNMLLRDRRVDPSDNDNRALYMATLHGRSEVVRILLAIEDVRNANLSDSFISAAKHGYLDIVDLFLTMTSIDPSIRNNLALKEAFYAQHFDIVHRLTLDPRFRAGKDDERLIKLSEEYLEYDQRKLDETL